MNRRSCWILLILALGMCIACLPAAAAHPGQAGPASSAGADSSTGGNGVGSYGDMSPGISSAGMGSSTGASIGPAGGAPGSHADQSSDSFVTGSPGSSGNTAGSPAGSHAASTGNDDSPVSPQGSPVSAAGSGNSGSSSSQSPVPSVQENRAMGDPAGASGAGSGARLADTDSGPPGWPGPSGEDPGRLSAATREYSPLMQLPDPYRGKQGSPEPMTGSLGGASGDSGNRGTAGAGQGQGSMAGTGAGSRAGAPGSREEPGGPGNLAFAIGATGAAGAARSGSESAMIPGPGTGRGPSPQRQQQGPPAQSGAFPCGPAQTTPLPTASGQAPNESKEENPLRNRFKRIGFLFRVTEPSSSATGTSNPPLPSLFPFGFLLFGGYRRISKKNVLDHDARHAIYGAITRRPGIDTKTLSDMTGINENTLRYHLVRLVATGKIASFTRPGVVRYFPNQGAYSSFEHRVLHYLWTDTPREILWLLYGHPGQARQHIADALAISGPSVTRQMEHLIGDGIVENRIPGRSNHYYLTEEAARTISRLMIPAPVMLPGETETLPLSIPAG